jgi:large subunit ribosomal protein L29
MADSRTADLRDMPDKELTEHIATARKEIFGLRFQNATGELENTTGLRASRRALARALTVARERELRAAKGVES